MKVTIELCGPCKGIYPTKQDIQKNLDALDRAIAGKKTAADDNLLIDTASILRGIQRELPGS